MSDVAEIALVPAPNEIKREGASRKIDVTCNVQGRDLGSVAREIEKRVRALDFEREYHPEFLGEYAAREESRRRLMALGALSLLGILLIIHADFRSVRLTAPGRLDFTLRLDRRRGRCRPGRRRSLARLTCRVRHRVRYRSPQRHHARQPLPPPRARGRRAVRPGLVLRGSEERLAPILMTALATGLALVPLAWAGNKPGHEIEHPMAVVILGGLVTSTLLNLCLMPALYLAFGRTGSRPEEEEAEEINTSGASGNNWASHSPQQALAAVAMPTHPVD